MAVGRALVLLLSLTTARIPSVDDAFLRHGPAVVGVRAGPAGAELATTGFFLTSGGLVATVMLPAERATVTLPDGSVRAARVVARQRASEGAGGAADGALTLLEVERAQHEEVFSALAVRTAQAPRRAPAWWLAITFTDGRAVPALGGLRRAEAGGRLRLDVPAAPGAPVLVDDEVVAVVVQRVDQTSSVALDVTALVELARSLPARAPPRPR